jgi:ribonuclease P protein subunit RPR2
MGAGKSREGKEAKEAKEKKGRAGKKFSRNARDRFRARRSSFQDVAERRIAGLFQQAGEVFPEDPGLSDKYVALARRLSTKYKVSFTKAQKEGFCKSCGSFLVQGRNSRVRLAKGNIVVSCGVCGTARRFRYR